MISMFSWAQVRNPTKGDWVTAVQRDLVEFGMPCHFEDIAVMSVFSFKKLVKTQAYKVTFRNFVGAKVAAFEDEVSGVFTVQHPVLFYSSTLPNTGY